MKSSTDIKWPLISCLCITERRVEFLIKAVHAFLCQTYPNKELVIVHKPDDSHTVEYLSGLNNPSIRSAMVDRDYETLGERRNFSIQQARGEYFCQWDDDDWYHNERLTIQFEAAKKYFREGSVLNQLIFFNKADGKAYFSYSRPWENTILYKTNMLSSGFVYQKLNQKEDTMLVKELIEHNKLSAVSFPAYIYIFHGTNTTAQSHYEDLCSMSQELSIELSKNICDIVTGVISNDQASDLLASPQVQQELNYFHIPPQLK